ncbi:hypothetical protein ACP2AV_13030 [Aliiroseovarius sp. PTFE2010]|uniref:hypothetical protein n=1 Tax=Aliiroseovarius sp. PTFE2010 TaxID=3417190 RepID=UPI003CE90487
MNDVPKQKTFDVMMAASQHPCLSNVEALIGHMESVAEQMHKRYPGNRDYARMCEDTRAGQQHISRMREALSARDKARYDAAFTGLRDRMAGYHNSVEKLADWRLA